MKKAPELEVPYRLCSMPGHANDCDVCKHNPENHPEGTWTRITEAKPDLRGEGRCWSYNGFVPRLTP